MMQIGNVEISAVTGNLFACDGVDYDGMAIFVMCGLTRFRPLSREFVRHRCTPTDMRLGRVQLFMRDDGIPVAYDANLNNHLFRRDEAYELIDQAMSVLTASGSRNILMNGIRMSANGRIHTCSSHEEDTLRALLRWIANHPDTGVRNVYCLSKKGEFGTALAALDQSNRGIDHTL